MKSFRIIAFLAMGLAFIVVMLGAYTRLTHAGLGCPDWPGCYGKMVVPTQIQEQLTLQQQYPAVPLEARKAWTEMIHRYVAGTLVLLIVGINFAAWRYRRQGAPLGIPLFLLALIGFQAALGMWTVTLKLLPIVVMGHLLGGLLIFGGLVYLNLSLHFKVPYVPPTRWRFWLWGAIGIVLGQIALGGWVSANYAGLACIGFPQCNGQWLPTMTWQSSFQFWSSIGLNYQGGVLDSASRATIQMVHRCGAVITLGYLISLGIYLLRTLQSILLRWASGAVFACVLIQFTLGIVNVIYMLPLWAAVAHNAVAALLFAAVLSLHFTVGKLGVSHDRTS